MNSIFYRSVNNRVKKYSYICELLRFLNTFLTVSFVVSFAVYLIFLLFIDLNQFLVSSTVNAVFFILISVLRIIFNVIRPYKKYSFDPILYSKKDDRSFPSRHLFSAFSISLSVLGFSPIAGVILICFSVLLGIVRFLSGVHYIIDLIFGAFAGIISGLVVLFLI